MQQSVLLARVAGPTGGDHVVPRVGAALAPGDDVVDVLRRVAAVLAAMAVASEDGAPVEGYAGLKGDPHVVPEADDRRLGEGPGGRVEEPVGRVHELGPAVEDQDQRPSRSNHAQGIEAGVQDEGPAHGAALSDRPRSTGNAFPPAREPGRDSRSGLWWNAHRCNVSAGRLSCFCTTGGKPRRPSPRVRGPGLPTSSVCGSGGRPGRAEEPGANGATNPWAPAATTARPPSTTGRAGSPPPASPRARSRREFAQRRAVSFQGPPSARGSFGSPRTISPRMLRWICELPA